MGAGRSLVTMVVCTAQLSMRRVVSSEIAELAMLCLRPRIRARAWLQISRLALAFRRESAAYAQRFVSVQSAVLNLLRVGRHVLRPASNRVLRARAFGVWSQVTCA